MKALVYTAPKTLEYRDADAPSPADGEIVVRVESVGICGSDMHAYLGHDERRPSPLILGHEAAGTVVSGPQEGRRVTINPLVTCMRCPACLSGHENLCGKREIISMPPRQGAFAQFVAIPERNLVTVPDEIPFEKAALAEPIACGWHAVKRAETTLPGALNGLRILVIGGGAIGVGTALSLKARGADDVIVVDANDGRIAYLAERIGLEACKPDIVASRSDFDVVVDCVGFAATRQDASARVRPGGTIVHIGLGEATGGLDIRRMTLQEITFIGTYTYTAADFQETAQAIFDGRLGQLDWSLQAPLSKGADAFADLLDGRIGAPKVILQPHLD